jgi:hypothetical protein
MRLWSLHPSYLDSKGLVALWREGLLALAVLEGRTRGYRHHPQLVRFQGEKSPADTMKHYLWFVYLESVSRGYHFDRSKIGKRRMRGSLQVTAGQLRFELEHLKKKLEKRDPARYEKIERVKLPKPHALFVRVAGPVEAWEKAGGKATEIATRAAPPLRARRSCRTCSPPAG